MKLDVAVKASLIHVAIRPSLFSPKGVNKHVFEREHRVWEQPFIAASNLVKFHQLTGEAVYETRVYTKSGTPMALAFARRSNDWEPLDRGDPISLLADLAGETQLVSRQERVTERKKELGIYEGSEWKDTHAIEGAYEREHRADDDDPLDLFAVIATP